MSTVGITSAFPDDLVPNGEKDSLEFGRKVGEAIANQWSDSGHLSWRRWWIREMRSYARGEQSTAKYKKIIEGDKEKAGTDGVKVKTHKIEYQTLKILPSFRDIVINAINEEDFKPRAEAVDRTSVNEKVKYFDALETNFYTQDAAKELGEALGINLSQPNMPQDTQELEARKLEYKPLIEEAQEIFIDAWFQYNRFEEIKNKHDEDLFDLGFAVGRRYTCPDEGIVLRYVDPFDFVHNAFEMDDARDVRYGGVYEKWTLGQVLKKVDKPSEEFKKQLKAAAGATTNDDEDWIEGEDNNRMIEVIAFNYLTTRQRTFKKLRKNKTTKAIDRSDDPKGYNPSNPNKKIEWTYETFFRGIYIPSINYCLEWEEAPNQIVDGVNRPISEYVIVAPKVKRLSERGTVRFDSRVQRAVPIVDDLHRDWYKFMQLKMELRPASVEIDTSALNNVMLNGERLKAETILEMFFGRSILLKNQINEDGDSVPQAITEHPGGVNSSALVMLSNEFTNNYNRLRQILGINELRDGTANPNSRSAIGVQKLLLASSSMATHDLVSASFKMSLRYAEQVSLAAQDLFDSEHLTRLTMDMIGTRSTELMEKVKSIPMHRFAIYHDFSPDSDERRVFEQSVLDAYQKQEISVGVYNSARLIRNTKRAVKYLEYHVKKKIEEDREAKLQEINAQGEANGRAAQIAEEERRKTMAYESRLKMSEEAYKSKLGRDNKKVDAMLDEIAKEADHERNKELKTIEAVVSSDRARQREDALDNRENLKKQNSKELIDYRRNKGGASSDIEKIISENPVINPPEIE